MLQKTVANYGHNGKSKDYRGHEKLLFKTKIKAYLGQLQTPTGVPNVF